MWVKVWWVSSYNTCWLLTIFQSSLEKSSLFLSRNLNHLWRLRCLSREFGAVITAAPGAIDDGSGGRHSALFTPAPSSAFCSEAWSVRKLWRLWSQFCRFIVLGNNIQTLAGLANFVKTTSFSVLLGFTILHVSESQVWKIETAECSWVSNWKHQWLTHSLVYSLPVYHLLKIDFKAISIVWTELNVCCICLSKQIK